MSEIEHREGREHGTEPWPTHAIRRLGDGVAEWRLGPGRQKACWMATAIFA